MNWNKTINCINWFIEIQCASETNHCHELIDLIVVQSMKSKSGLWLCHVSPQIKSILLFYFISFSLVSAIIKSPPQRVIGGCCCPQTIDWRQVIEWNSTRQPIQCLLPLSEWLVSIIQRSGLWLVSHSQHNHSLKLNKTLHWMIWRNNECWHS